MTTKKLNARQARRAEFLFRFYFLIKYRPGRQNTLADALSRPSKKQEDTDSDHWMQILPKPEQVERKHFIHGWNIADNTEPPADIEPLESDVHIVDQILWANQDSESLNELRDQAQDDKNEDGSWKLEDGLLLWKTDCLFLMMTLKYEHDYWMKCIVKFLLLTLGKQRHSNWSRTTTTGLHGEEMLNDMCRTAANANKQRIPEIRCLDFWTHCQYLNSLGNTYPWTSNHFPKTRKDMRLPLW